MVEVDGAPLLAWARSFYAWRVSTLEQFHRIQRLNAHCLKVNKTALLRQATFVVVLSSLPLFISCL